MLDLNHWREVLEKEKREVESQLARVGRVNPTNPNDWELTPLPERNDVFRDEVADDLEEMEERGEIELGLEQRLEQIRGALGRLKAGTYGHCEIGAEEIETERLAANPAARTCVLHREEENNLR